MLWQPATLPSLVNIRLSVCIIVCDDSLACNTDKTKYYALLLSFYSACA